MSNSPIPSSSSPTSTPTHRHALTAVEKQRSQLERLLKDPAKPAFVPAPPKEKAIRPAREMMKNVQGSSAGAGSRPASVAGDGEEDDEDEDASDASMDEDDFLARELEEEWG